MDSSVQPSPLLTKALIHITEKQRALDLGCGDGHDSLFLLKHFLEVDAVDTNKNAINTLSQRHIPKLSLHCQSFLNFAFGTYNLINAHWSLPFTPPESFASVMDKVKTALAPNGIFVGQFFGVHDSWVSEQPTMTFHTQGEVLELLEPLKILHLREVEKDGTTRNGERKHWHVFHVIAKCE